MSITLAQAKSLTYGEIFHVKSNNGKCLKWKVNGKVKTWKRDPSGVKVPVKHGMYKYGYLTEANIHMVEYKCVCPNCGKHTDDYARR